jgi:hypothetical protein
LGFSGAGWTVDDATLAHLQPIIIDALPPVPPSTGCGARGRSTEAGPKGLYQGTVQTLK